MWTFNFVADGTRPSLVFSPMLVEDARRLLISNLDLTDLTWTSGDVLAFGRGDGFVCVVNLATDTVRLPPYSELILASGPLDGDGLPPDTAAWLRHAD